MNRWFKIPYSLAITGLFLVFWLQPMTPEKPSQEESNIFIEFMIDKATLPSTLNYRLKRNPKLYNAVNDAGKNILMAAIEGSKIHFADTLIDNLKNGNFKLDINKQDKSGNTALHYAIENYNAFKYYRMEHVFDKLLELHPDVNLGNNNWNTPLHLAVKKSLAPAVRKLLDAKADPLKKNDAGKSAFDIAQEIGNLEIQTLILEYKPDLAKLETEKKQPLVLKKTDQEPLEKGPANNLLSALEHLTNKLRALQTKL